MVGKRGLKGIRNKFRQVLLIEGQPDFLYKNGKRNVVDLKIDGKTYKLGSVHSDLYEHLKKIPDCIVDVRAVDTMSTSGIPILKGLHIRKAGSNTTIEMSAPTEKSLFDKVNFLRDYLEEKGVPVTERCSWVCTIDKGKQESVKESSKLEIDVKDDDEKKKSIKKKDVKKNNEIVNKVEKTKELRQMLIRMGITGEPKEPDFQKARKLEKELNNSKRRERKSK